MLYAGLASEKHELKSYTLRNFETLKEVGKLSAEQLEAIKVVGTVLPFKTNNYVVNELIDWGDPEDPLFILNFPQAEMLETDHYSQMREALSQGDKAMVEEKANTIRAELNPHPAGQRILNIPRLKDGTILDGMQHKYDQTVLSFPAQGQTCHAYCTFCFRWPQFVKMEGQKFAMKEAEKLATYVAEHPEITDVLFTGGDPMIMRTKVFQPYIDALLSAGLDHIKNIRIGTKVLSYWPYRFLTDPDHKELLDLFTKVENSGYHLAFMAHFNHPRELQTKAAQAAISAVRSTGAEIRTQSPVLGKINDHEDIWAELWREQVNQGCIPYFMFATRDTGAQDYFGVPLARGWDIFQAAVRQVSGINRTVRGFSMSANPGKIQITGVSKVHGEKVFVLRFIQGRELDWTYKPFFAEYDEKAMWIDELKPAFGEKEFFFEAGLRELYRKAKERNGA